jgi:SpoVK/Ycf46/Vps4 family AAA+-type ATPase
MSQTDTEFRNLIQAKVPIIQIISYETMRIYAMLVFTAKELGRDLYIWNRLDGIKKWEPLKGVFVESLSAAKTHEDVLSYFLNGKNIILLLEDFHPDLEDNKNKPGVIRALRKIALGDGEDKKKTLVLSQPFRKLPQELEKEVHVFELPYPDAGDIRAVYRKVCREYRINTAGEPDQELINAALGLTIMEAEKAFSLAYIETGSLTKNEVPSVIKEKENLIKKSGYLEYYHPKEKMEEIGGLDRLKSWLVKRGRGFENKAAEYGLNYPRGILLLGIPGTGKSLTAKAIANLWHFPLLRLDMGKIFSKWQGESELNIREALNIACAIAPSILWIDEIEKGTAGIASSGETDNGTTARIMGTFLTWMQENTKPVFVVATANNVSKLPPELLRKGRVDEIFFTDLPVETEREKIIAIHLEKKKRDPAKFDIKELAKMSRGFSGAELEEAVKEALYQAYDDNGREVTGADIAEAVKKTYPLSSTMRESIVQMRRWAKNRAVPASGEEAESIDQEE